MVRNSFKLQRRVNGNENHLKTISNQINNIIETGKYPNSLNAIFQIFFRKQENLQQNKQLELELLSIY